MTHQVKTGMPTPAFSRICGFAGVGFALLIVLGNVVMVPAGLPVTGTETDEVITFFGGSTGADAVALASVLTPDLDPGHALRRWRGGRAVAVRARAR